MMKPAIFIVESKLVIFPENHNFDARASSYPERSRMVLEWFDQHS
jgi:hypothetical protein